MGFAFLGYSGNTEQSRVSKGDVVKSFVRLICKMHQIFLWCRLAVSLCVRVRENNSASHASVITIENDILRYFFETKIHANLTAMLLCYSYIFLEVTSAEQFRCCFISSYSWSQPCISAHDKRFFIVKMVAECSLLQCTTALWWSYSRDDQRCT